MRFCVALVFAILCVNVITAKDLLVLTVATEWNEPLERFLRSSKINGFDVKVLGLGEKWLGGDVSKTIGGGQKVKMLRKELQSHKNNDDLLILFSDSYDVVFMDNKERLLQEYEKIGSRVLFGAEDFCWPQQNLEKFYPVVGPNEKRFLNSGAFMGPASALYEIVTFADIGDEEDDQLYYTNVFLNDAMKKKLDIALDTTSSIFLNLHGALDELEVRFNDKTGYLVVSKTNTIPIVAHGNGPIKHIFNSITNYLAHSWSPSAGCQHCSENTIELNRPEEFPIVQLSITVKRPTPFLEVFFQRIAALNYPKNRIHLTGHVAKTAEKQRHLAEEFNQTYGAEYRSAIWLDSELDDGAAQDRAFANCLAIEDCQFIFFVDGTVQLTAPNTMEHLVHQNRSIIAPMVTRRGKLWSNFWGALSKDGYYERSDDYVEIVEGTRKGIWNVPFIRDVYMVSRRAARKLAEDKLSGVQEFELLFSRRAIEKNIFMMLDNQQSYGHLTTPETYTTEHLHDDLWQIFDNPMDWEEQYVHPGYFEKAAAETPVGDIAQPCPDVFWFPIVTEKFCKQLIDEMENLNAWSDGTNLDSRLEGGYENVPTRDIHMRQINWEEHWLHFLVKYIHPIQKKVYAGYDDKPWARMNFVVRYRPDEQPSLRAHHDASSYSLTIALNRPGIDYQGGGTKFNRYNCSVTKPKIGWTSMFPGRVTHLHEGLTTTSGTRYIFVTFVNP